MIPGRLSREPVGIIFSGAVAKAAKAGERRREIAIAASGVTGQHPRCERASEVVSPCNVRENLSAISTVSLLQKLLKPLFDYIGIEVQNGDLI